MFFGGWQIIGMIPLFWVLATTSTPRELIRLTSDTSMMVDHLGANLFLLLFLLGFVGGTMALWIWLRAAHKRKFKTVITGGKVNLKKFLFAFLVALLFNGVFMLIQYLTAPDQLVWNFNFETFLPLILMSLTLLLIQTGFEEWFFRGYIMQWLGVWWRNKWAPLLVTSVIFGLLHSFNPEMYRLGWGMMVFYIGFGLFMGIITIMDEGLELAMGFHWGNNFFGFAILTNDWGTAQTDALFKDLSIPEPSWDMYVPTLCLPLVYLLFKAIYKWGKISTIFKPVEAPIWEQQANIKSDTFDEV